MRNMIV